MFLHLSVSHSVHGGSTPPGKHTLGSTHPQEAHTHPQGSTPPLGSTTRKHTPLGKHPPGSTPPEAPPRDAHLLPPEGHCSGRYASYWNAFLFKINLNRLMLEILDPPLVVFQRHKNTLKLLHTYSCLTFTLSTIGLIRFCLNILRYVQTSSDFTFLRVYSHRLKANAKVFFDLYRCSMWGGN